MNYPIFISTSEADKILRIGKTTLYARINDGTLKTAKMGRATRITFESVIRYAIHCLQEGNGVQDPKNVEILKCASEEQSSLMGEHLVRRLCNIHCNANTNYRGGIHNSYFMNNSENINRFSSNNYRGEF